MELCRPSWIKVVHEFRAAETDFCCFVCPSLLSFVQQSLPRKTSVLQCFTLSLGWGVKVFWLCIPERSQLISFLQTLKRFGIRQRFPHSSPRGFRSIPSRHSLDVAGLKHELPCFHQRLKASTCWPGAATSGPVFYRLRTNVAVEWWRTDHLILVQSRM